MNRERLTILRDHLASLPDERVDMAVYVRDLANPTAPLLPVSRLTECGTAACIAGWAAHLFGGEPDSAQRTLELDRGQANDLFCPVGFSAGIFTRQDAIAAIQSMLDSPDDDALPVWPEAGQ